MTEIIAPNNTSADNAQAPSATFSKRVRRMLGLDLHSWEEIMIFSLAAAALVAGAVVVSTWAVIRLQREAVKEADVKISAAIGEAARANERAAEIEASVAWRRIPKSKQLEIASRLKRFSGQTVSLWYSAGDKESETFASEIASALSDAKWNVFSPAAVMTMAASGRPYDSSNPALETGVTIDSPLNGVSREAEDAILNELRILGFNAVKIPDARRSQSSDPVVIITVNVRPDGAQGEAKLRAQKKNMNGK